VRVQDLNDHLGLIECVGPKGSSRFDGESVGPKGSSRFDGV